MITAAQEEHIELHAYVPEQIPQYVTVISQTEPHLVGEFLLYTKKGHCIFVGYHLTGTFEEKRLEETLGEVISRFKPESVSLIAPSIPRSIQQEPPPPADDYYRLDLATVSISQKLRNMLRRAGRELSVRESQGFKREHRQMVEAFLMNRPLDEAARFIFQRIDAYLLSSKTAALFEARTAGGDLVAFDIAEFKPRDYALYMFNFRSQAHYTPGASDLLLSAVIERATAGGKKYINLGLGINRGVAFFKEKWGGAAFLPHTFCLYRPRRKGLLEALLRRL